MKGEAVRAADLLLAHEPEAGGEFGGAEVAGPLEPRQAVVLGFSSVNFFHVSLQRPETDQHEQHLWRDYSFDDDDDEEEEDQEEEKDADDEEEDDDNNNNDNDDDDGEG